MPLLEYEAGKTLFHRISPLVKVGWGMIVLLWLFMTVNPLHILLLGIAILVMAKFSAGLSIGRLLRTSAIAGVGGIFIMVFQSLLYPGQTVIVRIGPLAPTWEGVSVGLAMTLRILAIVAASAMIAKTTDPRDIFLSLVGVGVPYTIAYGMFAAIRFLPLMEYEADTIREAHMVRGIASQKGGLKSKIDQARNFLVPFIASGVRRAQQSAIALDVRGFGLSKERTYIRELEFSSSGKWFLAAWGVALIVFIVLTKGNLMGAVLFEPPAQKVEMGS